ncbi:hypothetical protein [Euzebya sp.]|uniref:hypothetical protein n=1 Tax=Euzebya sp. TaxID=1971409 RepID=UPI0035125EE7
MASHTHRPGHRGRHLALGLTTVLILTACGGSDDRTADAGPPDEVDPASTSTAGEASPSATDTTGTGTLVEADAAATDAVATDAVPTEEVAAAGGDGPGEGVEGCPAETTLSITQVSLDFPDEELLPETTFAGGHFVLDLDGSGFGPTLGGTLTTDPTADPVALGESWASPGAPPEGEAHVTMLFEGPPEGATEFPLGTYGVTFTDDVFAPTEGMGLSALNLFTADGSNRPLNRDNAVELTHIGDGVICGTVTSTGREPGPSNPVRHVDGAFVATVTEQP